jgi:hypothetical protein
LKLKPVFLIALLFSGIAVAFLTVQEASTKGLATATVDQNNTPTALSPTAIPATITRIPVSTPKQSDIETYLAELPAKLATYQTKYLLPNDIQEDFPLYPLNAHAFGVDAEGMSTTDGADYLHCAYKVAGCSPWDSSFYLISILKIAMPKNTSFIAVNYHYKRRMGGGQNASASHYGWKIDFNFAVIYEINPTEVCSTEVARLALADFNVEDGVFVLRKDGRAMKFQDYVHALC